MCVPQTFVCWKFCSCSGHVHLYWKPLEVEPSGWSLDSEVSCTWKRLMYLQVSCSVERKPGPWLPVPSRVAKWFAPFRVLCPYDAIGFEDLARTNLIPLPDY